MKKNLLLLLCISTATIASAQIQYSSTGTNSTQPSVAIDKLSGPRVGFTVISSGSISEQIESNFLTQFGYQFEKQIAGNEQIAGLIEGIVFIGGLEKGLFLPSISGLFGARTASGFEFAIGPNLSLSGAGIVVGFGKTITMGSINIPINFAFVPSTKNRFTNGSNSNSDYTDMTGDRFTVTIGFNFRN